jgi:hypothetical protein
MIRGTMTECHSVFSSMQESQILDLCPKWQVLMLKCKLFMITLIDSNSCIIFDAIFQSQPNRQNHLVIQTIVHYCYLWISSMLHHPHLLASI